VQINGINIVKIHIVKNFQRINFVEHTVYKQTCKKLAKSVQDPDPLLDPDVLKAESSQKSSASATLVITIN
jgi:hypothetical protein